MIRFSYILFCILFSFQAKASLIDKNLESRDSFFGNQKDLSRTLSKNQIRSRLYSADLSYPTIGPMVHSYDHQYVPTPFSATELAANPPELLKALMISHLEDFEVTYSFIIQGIEPDIQDRYALKPQYCMYPDSPTYDDNAPRTYEKTLYWKIIPGSQGNVNSAQQQAGLLPQPGKTISVHPCGDRRVNPAEIKNLTEKARVLKIMRDRRLNLDSDGKINMDDINNVPELQRTDPNLLILSGNIMHLTGINPIQSVDMYDLVAFDLNGRKRIFITYRWLLNPQDLLIASNISSRSRTFRDIIAGLGLQKSFSKILDELKYYINEPAILPLFPRNPSQEGINDVLLRKINGTFSLLPGKALPEGWRLWDGISLLTCSHAADSHPRIRVSQPSPGELQIEGDRYNVHRKIPELNFFKGEEITFSLEIKSNSSEAYLCYADGGRVINSKKHSGSGLWETLRLTLTISPDAIHHTFYPAVLGDTKSDAPIIELKNFNFYKKPNLVSLSRFYDHVPMKPGKALPEGWRLWDGTSLLTSGHTYGANPRFTITQKRPDTLKIEGDRYNLMRDIPELKFFPDEEVTISLELKSNAPGAYICYADGVSVVESTKHTGGGNWETLEIKVRVNPEAKKHILYPAILGSTNLLDTPCIQIRQLLLKKA